MRDNILHALQDGLFTAPAFETCDFHASVQNNTFAYIFDYPTKSSPYTKVRKFVIFHKNCF